MFFIFFTNSEEFLQLNGEFLSNGRERDEEGGETLLRATTVGDYITGRKVFTGFMGLDEGVRGGGGHSLTSRFLCSPIV
jgi:hypothetical protein